MYSLILFIFVSPIQGSAMTSTNVSGFSSLASCNEAGNTFVTQAENISSLRKYSFVCLKVE